MEGDDIGDSAATTRLGTRQRIKESRNRMNGCPNTMISARRLQLAAGAREQGLLQDVRLPLDEALLALRRGGDVGAAGTECPLAFRDIYGADGVGMTQSLAAGPIAPRRLSKAVRDSAQEAILFLRLVLRQG